MVAWTGMLVAGVDDSKVSGPINWVDGSALSQKGKTMGEAGVLGGWAEET